MSEGARRVSALEDGEEDGGKAVGELFVGFWAMGAGEEIAEGPAVRCSVGDVEERSFCWLECGGGVPVLRRLSVGLGASVIVDLIVIPFAIASHSL